MRTLLLRCFLACVVFLAVALARNAGAESCTFDVQWDPNTGITSVTEVCTYPLYWCDTCTYAEGNCEDDCYQLYQQQDITQMEYYNCLAQCRSAFRNCMRNCGT